jgi:RNA polymerase sigma-70 factor, ECF subfamily
LDELQLIQQILAGDEAAQNRFVLEHQKRLYPVAVHFLGYQDPDAEDIVQETFLIAFRKLKDFEPRSTLYTWLAHITINLCFERLRKRRRQLVAIDEDMERLVAPLSAEIHERQDEETDRQALIEKVRTLIGRLGTHCREVVQLRDIEGVSYADIGRKMKLPIGTVMSRLARCRETLKGMLSKSMGRET